MITRKTSRMAENEKIGKSNISSYKLQMLMHDNASTKMTSSYPDNIILITAIIPFYRAFK